MWSFVSTPWDFWAFAEKENGSWRSIQRSPISQVDCAPAQIHQKDYILDVCFVLGLQQELLETIYHSLSARRSPSRAPNARVAAKSADDLFLKCSPRAPAPVAAVTGAHDAEARCDQPPVAGVVPSLSWSMVLPTHLLQQRFVPSNATVQHHSLKAAKVEMFAQWLKPKGSRQQGGVSDACRIPLLSDNRNYRRSFVPCAKRVLLPFGLSRLQWDNNVQSLRFP